MIIISITMTLSIVFMMLKHPLSMIILIIIQTILISILTGITIKSFWFSYIIMMIMMSGMLVLFIYMASIASNEKFKFSMKMLSLVIMMPVLYLYISQEESEIINMSDLKMMLHNLFNMPTMLLTLMITFYLLFTMITISKIVNIHEGPLRIKK
uniref:NADH dehydrogenase subunit 6 n=1 Tax=Tropidothorax cruciger TaxID=1310363 RepID=A0A7T1X4J2_9HEMI|nr:NADH dehydrogenase subunit 6 [Tropidothorax cruciger]QPP20738.1 NADH dehydrogenase subunit 6 [Tropidothorax cruciger]